MTAANATEMMKMLQAMVGKIGELRESYIKIEESQNELRKQLGDGGVKSEHLDHPMTPPQENSLFSSRFGRANRMTMTQLEGSRRAHHLL